MIRLFFLSFVPRKKSCCKYLKDHPYIKVHIFWKGHKICETFTLLLTTVHTVKRSKVKISQNWPSQIIWTLSQDSFEPLFFCFSALHGKKTKLVLFIFWKNLNTARKSAYSFIWPLCGRHVIRKATYLTNLEVRNLKSEIWNLKSAVSALCGCLSFACFEKKWGNVSWIFQNSSIRHITNTFSYDMPTTKKMNGLKV